MGIMTDPAPTPGPVAGGMSQMPAKRRLPPARPVAVIVAIPGMRPK